MFTKKNIYQILFWVFSYFYVLDYFIDLENTDSAYIYAFIECAIYAVIAYVNLLVIIPKFYKKEKPQFYFFALCFFMLISLIPYSLLGFEEQLMGNVSLRSKLSYGLNFALYSLISFLYWYFELYQKEQQRALKLENLQLNTEINLLKAQISPHFLFNSLNNIYSLSIKKSDDTPKMVANFSEVLRYLIYDGQKDRVPLSREIELIHKYIEIHKLRKFKGAKNINFEVSGVLGTHKIIPLLLINFVENAFKHGDVQYNDAGYLKINFTVTNEQQLHIKIDNSKKGTLKENGIGLSNVKKQLELNYGVDYELITNDNLDSYSIELKVNV